MRSFHKPREIARAFRQLGLPFVFGGDEAVRPGNGGGDVRPARQLAAVLPGKVEQHREHLRGEFDRDTIDPVEHLTARQIVQALGRTLADAEREIVQMRRGEHRRHGLALRRVARRIHRDETLAAQVRVDVADGDAAERGGRGEHRMVGLDLHDVVVARHRPVRPEHRVLAIVHGILAAQAIEIGPERIRPEQLGIARIELLQRQ
ncbi:hypothetical protein ABIF73_000525 [Bradyrhizobium japonicum]